MVDINNSILRFRHQTRSDTLANFNIRNEVLAVGEVVFVIDQNKIKIGDGKTPFQSLNFVTTDVAEVAQTVVSDIEVDTINEATSGGGVTIDGVLIKDGDVTATGGQVYINQAVNPFLIFNVTGGAVTHNKPSITVTDSAFAVQTRDDNNTNIATDYVINRNTTGAFRHSLRIADEDKLIVDSFGNTLIKGLANAEQGISFDNGTNTLEHYEEGAFTPTLFGGTTAGNINYVFRDGSYIRIGNLCYVTFRLAWTSLGGATGTMRISGLPFTIRSGNQHFAAAIPSYYHSINLPSGTSLGGYGVSGSTTMLLKLQTSSTASGIVTEEHLTETGNLYFNLTYII